MFPSLLNQSIFSSKEHTMHAMTIHSLFRVENVEMLCKQKHFRYLWEKIIFFEKDNFRLILHNTLNIWTTFKMSLKMVDENITSLKHFMIRQFGFVKVLVGLVW